MLPEKLKKGKFQSDFACNYCTGYVLQLVELASPKLVDWVRIPGGPYRTRENGACVLASFCSWLMDWCKWTVHGGTATEQAEMSACRPLVMLRKEHKGNIT